MKIYACAIIGHRPTRFKFKYKENFSLCKKIKRSMAEQFKDMYDKGVRQYFIGGALGVDLWAGELLIELKRQPTYEEIELIVVLPFSSHDSQWDTRSKERLAYLLEHCTKSIKIRGGLRADSYKRQSYYMVEQADLLLAVYDNDRSKRSNIGQTVNYAKKNGVSIIYIHPDTANVTSDKGKKEDINS